MAVKREPGQPARVAFNEKKKEIEDACRVLLKGGSMVLLKGGGGVWNPKAQMFVHQKQPNQYFIL